MEMMDTGKEKAFLSCDGKSEWSLVREYWRMGNKCDLGRRNCMCKGPETEGR